MGERPLIGIPTETLPAREDPSRSWPEGWMLPQRYGHILATAGAVPLLLPLLGEDSDALRACYETLDGVFLAGGADVHPDSYAQPLDPRCGRTDPARDRVEIQLVRWAAADGMPLLGACRGMQLINVALGGTLYQDLRACRPATSKHDYFPEAGHARDYVAHEVRLARGARLAQILGTLTISVNSMHHQGIEELGAGLHAVGHAPDGVVEAVEGDGEPFLAGVQWHPETLPARDPLTRKLFAAFVAAAATYRDGVRRAAGRDSRSAARLAAG